MKRKTAIVISIAVIALLGSCELALGPRSEGTIILNLGGGPASRALSDPPFSGALPVFSSVTITVSGSGMPTASQTVPGNAGSVSIQVPAGPARRVEVYAAVDWAATADLEQFLGDPPPFPTLAKAYGGTAVVDVAGGQKVPVSMNMDVVETKIVLPYVGGVTRIADSFSGSASIPSYFPSLGADSDFEFDKFGRLLVSRTYYGYLSRYSDLSGGDEEYPLADASMRITYDSLNERVYYLIYNDYFQLGYLDLKTQSTGFISIPVDLTLEGFQSAYGIAVDKNGYIYLPAYYAPLQDGRVIAKLRVFPDGETLSAELDKYVTYKSLGLRYNVDSGEPYSVDLVVQDMYIQDSILYIAAGDHEGQYFPNSTVRGKIVAVRTSDLTRYRELGWSTTNPISDPTTQFYGPKRFLAIVPRKLIIGDTGYNSETESEIARVIEIDVDSWSISGIGFNGLINLPSVYYC